MHIDENSAAFNAVIPRVSRSSYLIKLRLKRNIFINIYPK